MKRVLLTGLTLAGALFLASCPEENGLEEAGEAVDEAIDDVEDAAEEAGDEIEDAVDDAGN